MDATVFIALFQFNTLSYLFRDAYTTHLKFINVWKCQFIAIIIPKLCLTYFLVVQWRYHWEVAELCVTISSDGFNSMVLLSINWFYVSRAIHMTILLFICQFKMCSTKRHIVVNYFELWYIFKPSEKIKTNNMNEVRDQRPETHTQNSHKSQCVLNGIHL